jgi:hypothetical protein
VSLSKGALIVGVAASAAMVSNAEFSSAPSHNEPSPSAIVSATPTTTPPVESSTKPTDKPVTDKPATEPKAKHSDVPSTSAEGLARECVTKYTALRAAGDNATQGERESASAVCKAAIEQSGLTSSQFAAKYGLETTATSHPSAPTTTAGGLSPEALAMAKECVTKYNLHSADASATCISAIKLSGLTSSEFAAKFFPPRTTEPTQSPTAVKPATAELEGLIYACRKLQGAIVPGSSAEQANTASAACAKAIAASGLSATAFWAKWAPIKPATTPAATPAPVSATDLAKLIATCLDLYKAMAITGDTHATSEACGAAIRASGMTSSDFWAKYHPATN